MNLISQFKILLLRTLFRKNLIIMNCTFHGNVNVGNLNQSQDSYIMDSRFIGLVLEGEQVPSNQDKIVIKQKPKKILKKVYDHKWKFIFKGHHK